MADTEHDLSELPPWAFDALLEARQLQRYCQANHVDVDDLTQAPDRLAGLGERLAALFVKLDAV